MPRKRRFVGHGLDRMPRYRKEQRVYDGGVGSLNTLTDIHEWIRKAESDHSIKDKLRQKRIHNMYAITFTKRFMRQWRGQLGDIETARKALKHSYERYMAG